jgi:hypothetical protein
MPLSWDRLEDGVLVGPEAIQELKEQLQMIRKGMEEAQDRHKGLSMCIASTIIMKGLMASVPHSLRHCMMFILYPCVNLGQ